MKPVVVLMLEILAFEEWNREQYGEGTWSHDIHSRVVKNTMRTYFLRMRLSSPILRLIPRSTFRTCASPLLDTYSGCVLTAKIYDSGVRSTNKNEGPLAKSVI